MEELNLRHASVLNAAARISLTGLLLLFTIFLGCGSSDKDADGDGVGGNADNCPAVSNPGQENLDGDAFGDVCDDDRDGDGVTNASDAFPDDASETTDIDGDGVGGNADNCPAVSNPGQENLDGDAFGDVCDDDLPPSTPTGTWDDTEWDRSKWGEWHPPIDSCLTQRMLVPCNLRSRRS